MTRRRDLFKQIAGFVICISLFLIFFHLILDTPLAKQDWKYIYSLIGIEFLIIGISSFYVWRANIKNPKKVPEYLIDFPDSAVYLLSFPIFSILFIVSPVFSKLSSFGEQILFVFANIFLLGSLLFIATIIVDGFALFVSSKYSQAKKRTPKDKEESTTLDKEGENNR